MMAASPSARLRPPLTLVGRDPELDVIDHVIETCRRGSGGLVTVWGESGLGKSRLLIEAIRRARALDVDVVWGAGWGDGVCPPLWPWQDIADQVAPHADALPDAGGFAVFHAVARRLVRAARARPLLVVIDDAQFLDPDALALLRFLVHTTRCARLGCIAAVRTDSTSDATAPVVGVEGDRMDGHAVQLLERLSRDGISLHLAPLDPATVGQLVDQVADRHSPELAADVYCVTGGNPLLVHEVLTAHDLGEHVSDTSIAAVIGWRLRRVQRAHHRTLVAAAILGRLARVDLVASAVGTDLPIVHETRAAATAVGLLDGTAPSTDFCFAHGSYADALIRSLAHDELLTLRRDVAQALATRHDSQPHPPSSEGDDALIVAAELLLRVADETRSREDLTEAVRTASRAAEHLGAHAHRSAASLLRRAAELADRNGGAPQDLVLAAANASLTAGELATARPWFHRLLPADTDTRIRAEAALGYGGIWVHEHREVISFETYLATLHGVARSLDESGSLPDLALAAQVRARIAAELAYVGRCTLDDVRDAVATVRSSGDPNATRRALSLLLHCLLGPAHSDERHAVCDELIRVASTSADDLDVLVATMWRAVDLRLVGDRRAERALRELRDRAAVLHVDAIEFVIAALDVADRLRAGRIDDAEATARTCLEFGVSVGDADALPYFGAHLMAIRWLQGRSEEVLPLAREVASSSTLVDGTVVNAAAIAALAADAGRLDEADAMVSEVLAHLPGELPLSSNTLVVGFCLAEAALALDHQAAAAAARELLEPHASLPILVSFGVACLGSPERSLGLLAAAAGDPSTAIERLRRAVEHCDRIANRPMAAITRGDLGTVLARNGSRADRIAGRQMLVDAAGELASMGLTVRASRLSALATTLPADQEGSNGRITTGNGRIELAWNGVVVELDDSIGLRRIVQLLRNPRSEVSALELAGAVTTAAQEVVDTTALADYRRRIDELRADLDDARLMGDIGGAERCHIELDAVLDEVRRSTRFDRRARAFSDPAERARIAVQKSIRRSLDRITALVPDQGADLAACITTGTRCTFRPVDDVPATWELIDAAAATPVG